jgi:opacity protein-like surface antigen
MRNKVIIGLTLIASVLMLLPSDADAHRYYRRRAFGFRHQPHAYFGGQLMGMAVVNQSIRPELQAFNTGAAGGGLFGGFRISPFFAVEGNWWITYNDISADYYDDEFLETLFLTAVTVDGKVFIPTRGPFEPYFQAGIGYSWVGSSWSDGYGGDSSATFASGLTFAVGGGIDFYLGPHFSIGGRLLYRGFYFGEVRSRQEKAANFMSTVSFDANATIHF